MMLMATHSTLASANKAEHPLTTSDLVTKQPAKIYYATARYILGLEPDPSSAWNQTLPLVKGLVPRLDISMVV